MTGPPPDKVPGFPLNGFADQDAFADFYSRTAAALHGFATKMTRDASAADDILQMAYLRLLRAPPMDDAHRRAYLYKAASSIIIDRWRSMARERDHFTKHPSVESSAVDQEQSLDLHRLMDQLSGREQALLWLAYAEGFAHAEIAEILGVSQKSVKVMLFRVREKARKLLGQSEDGS